MVIKAIFFDMGGVILNNFQNKSFRQSLAGFLGLDYEKNKQKIDKILDKLVKGKITEREFWEELFQTFNVQPKKGYKKFFLKELCDNWVLNKETLKIVKSVKTLGYKVALISNTIKPQVEYMKKKGWYKPFPILILSNEVGTKKPEIKIYKLALKKLKVRPSESVFIDDKEKNILSAKKLGMKTILFKDANQLKDELIKLGVNLKS